MKLDPKIALIYLALLIIAGVGIKFAIVDKFTGGMIITAILGNFFPSMAVRTTSPIPTEIKTTEVATITTEVK